MLQWFFSFIFTSFHLVCLSFLSTFIYLFTSDLSNCLYFSNSLPSDMRQPTLTLVLSVKTTQQISQPDWYIIPPLTHWSLPLLFSCFSLCFLFPLLSLSFSFNTTISVPCRHQGPFFTFSCYVLIILPGFCQRNERKRDTKRESLCVREGRGKEERLVKQPPLVDYH